MMTTIFVGTPALAVPFLERLAQNTSIQAVITAPDQPAGRGYELKAPEVKVAAQKLSLPVFQPETLKNPALADQIRALGAEVGIVVAYGKLLPKEVLAIPRLGFLNVHFSLLPEYRGAAPIQWALINGEKETGVTLFWLDEGMDTGPIFLQKCLPIAEEDDAESLRQKLVPLGVQVLNEALDSLGKGQIARKPQVGLASQAPILKKEDGQIRWSEPAKAVVNRIRGTTPWPGAFCYVGQARLKILKARKVFDERSGEEGTITGLVSGEGIVVKCGQDSLKVLQVQPEGKKPMSAWEWWQGARLKQGDKLR